MCGHSSLDTVFGKVESYEGKSLELSLTVKDWKQAREKEPGDESVIRSEEKSLGDFSFQIKLFCCGDKDSSLKGKKDVSLFLFVKSPQDSSFKTMVVDYSLFAFNEDNEIKLINVSKNFIEDGKSIGGFGCPSFVSEEKADKYE
eukprot:15333010-Ditylum_brightwellii.AAC.1